MRCAFLLSFQNVIGNVKKLDRECYGGGKGTEKNERERKMRPLDAAILRSLKLCWAFLQLLESLK